MSRIRTPRWPTDAGADDPSSPELFAASLPLLAWRQARRRHPVAWVDSPAHGGFWAVTGYRAACAVLRDPAGFTSVRGMRLGGRAQSVDVASGRMLVVSDGDQHRRLGAAHRAAFGRGTVTALQPWLDRVLDRLLTTLVERCEPVEAVGELAVRVPTWALFRLLGVPAQDQDRLGALTDQAFDDTDGGAAGVAARTKAHARIFAYFSALVRQRRDGPGDDLVSQLLRPGPDGEQLPDEVVVLNCAGIVNGGLETLPHAISGALLLFAESPHLWRELLEQPGRVDSAVEEILRWTSPAMHVLRTVVADTSLAGVDIPAGDRVVVWIPSCNRDESVFEAAEQVRLDRNPNPHLGFGSGPHYCVGARLARLELACVLRAMIRQVGHVELAGEARRKRSNFLNGLDRLPVRLHPAGGRRAG